MDVQVGGIRQRVRPKMATPLMLDEAQRTPPRFF